MPKAKPTAYGYARVSTPGQVSDGVSLETQRQAIRDYCTENQIRLADIFEDEGISAGHMRRAGLQQLLQVVREKRPDMVLATRVDRVSKNVEDFPVIIDGLHSHDSRLVTFNDELGGKRGFDSREDERAMTIMTLFGQWQREQRSTDTKAALKQLRSEGTFPNHPPFGFDRKEDGALTNNHKELWTALRIRAMRGDGDSFREIAATLNGEKLPAKMGGVWYPQTVKNVCENIDEYKKAYDQGFAEILS